MTTAVDLAGLGGETQGFPSLAALSTAHAVLLKYRRDERDTREFVVRAEDFVRRARATGAVLDVDRDRWAAQGLLDYWCATLYRMGYEILDGTLLDFDPTLAPELSDEACPYVGLYAFREGDQGMFFGRRRLIEEWAGRLRSHRLLAVVGPSGSGKSSLVSAGLVPALQAGALPGSEGWRYYPPVVPGSDPLNGLARLIPPPGDGSAGWLERRVAELRRDPRTLTRLLGEGDDAPAVVIVDQFEEIFTLCADDEERQAYAANLVSLARAKNARHTVILTLRSDFESHIVRLTDLAPAFERARVHITSLNAVELREAIEGPAARVGLKFEEGVVDQLVKEILGEQAGLPLLQFTLLKLWENRERDRVTWERYRRLGGARLALARSANDFYEALIPEEQSTARRILLRMVRPGEGLEVTSNRVRRETLYAAGEDQGRVDRVLDKLIRARLVRVTEGDTPADAQVEVAHEALVRNWPRLVEWLDEARSAMRQRLRLTAAAEQWQARGREPEALWRGSLLRDAAQCEDLNQLEVEFVAAGREAEEAAEREQREAQERELRQARDLADTERRRARLARRLVTVTVSLFILALALAVVAFWQSRVAQQQKLIATSRELAANALLQIPTDPELSILLSKRAAEMSETAQARDALSQALLASRLRAVLRGHTDQVSGATFSPDGRLIATASFDRTARVWNARTGSLLHVLRGHADLIYSVAFSHDSRYVLTAGQDGTARVWDAGTGMQVKVLAGHRGPVYSATFSPDGRLIATAGADQTARLWDARTDRPRAVLSRHTGAVYSVAFSPDGTYLVTASADGTAAVWAAHTGALVGILRGHQDQVLSAVYSPNGRYIATASVDGTARLWDTRRQYALVAVMKGHKKRVYSVAFSPDSKFVVAAGADRMAQVWTVKGARVKVLQGHSDVVSGASFSPDGKSIVTTSFDTTMRLWDAHDYRLLSVLRGHKNRVYGAAFSPDGRFVVTPSKDGTARIWDVESADTLLRGHIGAVRDAVFSPDGRLVVTAGDDGTVRLWDARTGAAVGGPVRQAYKASSAAFSPDSRTVVTASLDGTVRLWDVRTHRPLGPPLLGSIEGMTDAQYSPHGHFVIATSADGMAWIWDVRTRRLLRVLRQDTGKIVSAVFSPDGRLIATLGSNNTAQVWDAHQFRVLGVLRGDPSKAYSMAFSPDSTHLLDGTASGQAWLWNVQTLHPVITLRSGAEPVRTVAFSPDGRFMATGGDDRVVRIWDAESYNLVAILSSHTKAVTGVGFSPDDRSVVSSSVDGTAEVSPCEVCVRFGDLLRLAGTRVTRQFTPEEKREYLSGQ